MVLWSDAIEEPFLDQVLQPASHLCFHTITDYFNWTSRRISHIINPCFDILQTGRSASWPTVDMFENRKQILMEMQLESNTWFNPRWVAIRGLTLSLGCSAVFQTCTESRIWSGRHKVSAPKLRDEGQEPTKKVSVRIRSDEYIVPRDPWKFNHSLCECWAWKSLEHANNVGTLLIVWEKQRRH